MYKQDTTTTTSKVLAMNRVLASNHSLNKKKWIVWIKTNPSRNLVEEKSVVISEVTRTKILSKILASSSFNLHHRVRKV